jgi:hypothetical protein
MTDHPGLWLGEDLRFPPDVVTETLLIIAKRGSGKTHCASVLVEEMIKAGLRSCVIDPIGVWWGLRSNAAGDGPGLPVTILGGEHADLDLSPEAGTVVADLVISEQIPFVLDLSLMSKTQQRRFVTDFLERLYHRNRDPLHLVVDEADLFAPLRGGKDTMRLLGAYEDIVRRGRARGLGCTSITQRPAVLHTDIRSQAEVLIALRLIGTHDVAAIDEWVRLHATDEEAREVKASLPSLPVGTAWVWSPGWLEILTRVKIRQRLTFDSSATPKVGQQRIVPREFARVDGADLDRLAAKLAPPAPAAKTAKPAQRGRMPDEEWRLAEVGKLKAQVAELQRQLAEAAEPERVEVPVLGPGDVAALEQAITGLRDVAGNLELALGRAVRPAPAPAPRQTPTPRPTPLEPRRDAPTSVAPSGTGGALPKAQRLILTVLAQFPDGRTMTQLGMLTGYSSKGGGFRSSLSALRTAGYITRGEIIRATPEGIAVLGGDWEPLPTGRALLDHWLGQLGRAEREILTVLVGAWPESLNAAEIAARTESQYSPSGGGYRNALSRLRTLLLITGSPEMRADDTLAQAARETV